MQGSLELFTATGSSSPRMQPLSLPAPDAPGLWRRMLRAGWRSPRHPGGCGWHGAAGLGVEAELLEPCPQHLHCFLSLALHGLSKQLCMARGMDPPSEHGQHEREGSHVPGTSSALLLLLAGRSGTMPLEQAGFGDPDGGMCPGDTGQQGGFCRNFSFPGRGPASKDLCEGKGER